MLVAQRPDWRGRTVVCIASGPSLTAEDCAATRGHTTIVTNTSFRAAPWADVLFGFDSRWWRAHMDEVKKTFAGRRLSVSQIAPNLGIETTFGQPWFRQFGNSGACAVSLAVAGRAARVIMLGFDCGFTPSGQKHWHGDHPAGFSNCMSIKRWPDQFGRLAEYAKKEGVQVINASRYTVLRCFSRVNLAEVLQPDAVAA